MTVTKSDLSFISNYIESDKPSLPQLQFNYIDMVESESEEAILARKSKNRELAIDAIVEGKIEEFNNREIQSQRNFETDSLSGMSIISPVIKTVTVTGVNYISNDEIYYAIIKKLDLLSSQQMKSGSMDIKLENNNDLSYSENLNHFARKIITKIMSCSNKIAVESRLGPANTVVCGLDIYHYLMNSQSLSIKEDGISKAQMINLNIVPTNLISDKKVIILRVSNKFECGINCGNYTKDLRYFIKETPNYEKCIKWFSII